MPTLEDFTPPNLTIDTENLHHIFTEEDCYALWAAYAAGRPLLVRGKTGTGKSQLARAIAAQLGWAFVGEVIRGNTELSDLHWHFDAIGRLGEAQAMSRVDPDLNALKAENFLSPGAFWWAYDWGKADNQYTTCRTKFRDKPKNTPNAHEKGVVLLLDEIDKAEPDLPNGLLETLGNYEFTVPYINKTLTAKPERVLVIITTNEERELPTAFVRRCFVHTLKMEESVDWLKARGQLHFGDKIAVDAQQNIDVYADAAQLLLDDRKRNTRYPPGLAEYIDLLEALSKLPHKQQPERLGKIAAYALAKELPTS
ncbi:MAG: MoxR family ATPase [Methylococcales bacterium]|nr:MoxR family ATPase [Methylococcales bacterium]